jgi:hypothetical protein
VPQQRDAREHASALAEHEHRVEGVQPGAAVGLVYQQARPAGLFGHRPQVGQRALVLVERLTGGL